MPEKGDKESLEKAREDIAEGKAPTTAAGEWEDQRCSSMLHRMGRC